MDKLWNLTINGSTASYDYYGASKTDTLGSCMQYYLDNSALAPAPPAGEPGTQVIFTIGSKTYLSGGEEKTGDVAPYIVRGYTYLPLYCVCAELGAQVTWNGETKTVTLTKGGTALVLTIGSKTMMESGVSAIAPDIRETALGLGFGGWKRLLLLVNESAYQIVTTYLLGLSRALAEVGAVSMQAN